ncbi:Piso0_003670 [Millerozyma farinosa CBS 7064]|uniref:Piso0_003670 protein n=1 Tax=Pichia sorbitophila (strain ATCC MYA-4447 / BCRC 22081 / CBS 7064 / NBRC 10061 / NRRL Y-12695) TaxID=559304 RepID=G8YGJ9_PICSO|nr:Piso0_003670 [Millerozyma farinosa CBS 7064]CCE81316.1 Piso0_003670 [Millerozyma farinosa CBS 7064]
MVEALKKLLVARDAASELSAQTSTLKAADMVYVMFCAFGVFLITPSIALYYTGSLRRKNVVQVLFQSYMTTCNVVILWYLLGYSLANSPSSTSKLIGDLTHGGLHDEQARPLIKDGTIPSVINFCFNVFFPVATVQIFIGSIGERGRFLPSQVITVIWTIVVYCPLAFWVWGSNGWLDTLGALDFAGGGPVHIASGVASLCYSWFLGPREDPTKKVTKKIVSYRGHSALTTFIGVTFIWAAWFCFNTGTLLAVNVRTGYIMLNTILASCFASVTYVTVDKMLTGKYSMQAACEGVVVGLVNITPSCGFYWPWAAAVTSIINATICRLSIGFNNLSGIDDYSRSGIIHGLGGIIGGTLTGIFATKTVAGYDGATDIDGGWIDGNFVQLGYQIAAWVSIVAWTGSFTMIILFLVDKIPYLKLRATVEGEEMGMDLYEMQETLDEFANNYEAFFEEYMRLKNMGSNLSYGDYGKVEVLDGTTTKEELSHTDKGQSKKD